MKVDYIGSLYPQEDCSKESINNVKFCQNKQAIKRIREKKNCDFL